MAQILIDGALTIAAMQATAWVVWQSSMRQWAGIATALGGRCLGNRTRAVAKAATPITPPSSGTFEVFANGDGTHRFRMVAGGGQEILTSRDYRDANSARNGLKTFLNNAVLDERYERRTDSAGAGFFELRAGNNRVLWTSAPFETAEALESALQRLITTARQAAAAI
jgi:uncharacterized protein YegP (UPF0339 family)